MNDPAWRTLYVLILLFIASWIDIKSKEVPNALWLGFIPASSVFSLSAAGMIQSPDSLQLARSVLEATSIALLFFGLGIFGGADMKAIVSISYVFPFEVRPALPLISAPVWLPLSTLIDATLASGLISLVIRDHRKAKEKEREGYPFLPFITLGFITALAVGDPYSITVSYLSGIF